VGVYILRDLNSDLATPAAGTFYKQLLTTTATIVSVSSGTIGADPSTVNAYAYTNAGDPGVIGANGVFSVEMNVTVASTTATVTCAVAQVDSTGFQVNQTAFATAVAATVGVKLFNFAATSGWTWLAGDRLRVTYRFIRTAGAMGTTTVTIGVNTTASEVTVPWTPAPPAGGLAPVLLRERRLTSALIQM
jgi:hypothetical protein